MADRVASMFQIVDLLDQRAGIVVILAERHQELGRRHIVIGGILEPDKEITRCFGGL
jgi:hypothetical protein